MIMQTSDDLADTQHQSDSVNINIRSVPRWIRNLFKAHCAKNNQSMQNAILMYMTECAVTYSKEVDSGPGGGSGSV